jgi:hypothetical protein
MSSDSKMLDPKRIKEIACSLPKQPWGIDSRMQDAMEFANKLYEEIVQEHNKDLGLREQALNLQHEAELELSRKQSPEAQWITKLRQEVMVSKMTHNFTFTRDEVIELLGGKFNLLKESK